MDESFNIEEKIYAYVTELCGRRVWLVGDWDSIRWGGPWNMHALLRDFRSCSDPHSPRISDGLGATLMVFTLLMVVWVLALAYLVLLSLLSGPTLLVTAGRILVLAVLVAVPVALAVPALAGLFLLRLTASRMRSQDESR